MERIPSAEARAWGRKKAAERPRWSDEKWQRIGSLYGVQISGDTVETSATGEGAEVAA